MTDRYREVEILRDPDGVIAVITQRTDTGYFSFRIQKEYVLQGQIRATSYLGPHHIEAGIRLLQQVHNRIAILSDRARVARAQAGYSNP
jgi:hypothetical protein